jgi:hypothetical protein
MSEDKLRAQFEVWYEADSMPSESNWFKRDDQYPDEYHYLATQISWGGFQSCAKIKDAEIQTLKGQLSTYQKSEFHPDWSMLEACQDSLREHMGIINLRDDEIAELNNKITGLTKQRNAYKTADDARNKLIDWKVEIGVKERTKELNSLSSERDANAILTEEIEQLNAELERERMRLAACGVVALANTEQSATKARLMHDDYRSASCDDVARMVDVQMKLRTQVEQLNTKVAMMHEAVDELCSPEPDFLRVEILVDPSEADVTKFLNGVRADAVAEYRRQSQVIMCKKVVM